MVNDPMTDYAAEEAVGRPGPGTGRGMLPPRPGSSSSTSNYTIPVPGQFTNSMSQPHQSPLIGGYDSASPAEGGMSTRFPPPAQTPMQNSRSGHDRSSSSIHSLRAAGIYPSLGSGYGGGMGMDRERSTSAGGSLPSTGGSSNGGGVGVGFHLPHVIQQSQSQQQRNLSSSSDSQYQRTPQMAVGDGFYQRERDGTEDPSRFYPSLQQAPGSPPFPGMHRTFSNNPSGMTPGNNSSSSTGMSADGSAAGGGFEDGLIKKMTAAAAASPSSGTGVGEGSSLITKRPTAGSGIGMGSRDASIATESGTSSPGLPPTLHAGASSTSNTMVPVQQSNSNSTGSTTATASGGGKSIFRSRLFSRAKGSGQTAAMADSQLAVSPPAGPGGISASISAPEAGTWSGGYTSGSPLLVTPPLPSALPDKHLSGDSAATSGRKASRVLGLRRKSSAGKGNKKEKERAMIGGGMPLPPVHDQQISAEAAQLEASDLGGVALGMFRLPRNRATTIGASSARRAPESLPATAPEGTMNRRISAQQAEALAQAQQTHVQAQAHSQQQQQTRTPSYDTTQYRSFLPRATGELESSSESEGEDPVELQQPREMTRDEESRSAGNMYAAPTSSSSLAHAAAAGGSTYHSPEMASLGVFANNSAAGAMIATMRKGSIASVVTNDTTHSSMYTAQWDVSRAASSLGVTNSLSDPVGIDGSAGSGSGLSLSPPPIGMTASTSAGAGSAGHPVRRRPKLIPHNSSNSSIHLVGGASASDSGHAGVFGSTSVSPPDSAGNGNFILAAGAAAGALPVSHSAGGGSGTGLRRLGATRRASNVPSEASEGGLSSLGTGSGSAAGSAFRFPGSPPSNGTGGVKARRMSRITQAAATALREDATPTERLRAHLEATEPSRPAAVLAPGMSRRVVTRRASFPLDHKELIKVKVRPGGRARRKATPSISIETYDHERGANENHSIKRATSELFLSGRSSSPLLPLSASFLSLQRGPRPGGPREGLPTPSSPALGPGTPTTLRLLASANQGTGSSSASSGSGVRKGPRPPGPPPAPSAFTRAAIQSLQPSSSVGSLAEEASPLSATTEKDDATVAGSTSPVDSIVKRRSGVSESVSSRLRISSSSSSSGANNRPDVEMGSTATSDASAASSPRTRKHRRQRTGSFSSMRSTDSATVLPRSSSLAINTSSSTSSSRIRTSPSSPHTMRPSPPQRKSSTRSSRAQTTSLYEVQANERPPVPTLTRSSSELPVGSIRSSIASKEEEEAEREEDEEDTDDGLLSPRSAARAKEGEGDGESEDQEQEMLNSPIRESNFSRINSAKSATSDKPALPKRNPLRRFPGSGGSSGSGQIDGLPRSSDGSSGLGVGLPSSSSIISSSRSVSDSNAFLGRYSGDRRMSGSSMNDDLTNLREVLADGNKSQNSLTSSVKTKTRRWNPIKDVFSEGEDAGFGFARSMRFRSKKPSKKKEGITDIFGSGREHQRTVSNASTTASVMTESPGLHGLQSETDEEREARLQKWVKERRHVIRELIETEDTYASDLAVVRDIFIERARAKLPAASSWMASPQAFSNAFANSSESAYGSPLGSGGFTPKSRFVSPSTASRRQVSHDGSGLLASPFSPPLRQSIKSPPSIDSSDPSNRSSLYTMASGVSSHGDSSVTSTAPHLPLLDSVRLSQEAPSMAKSTSTDTMSHLPHSTSHNGQDTHGQSPVPGSILSHAANYKEAPFSSADIRIIFANIEECASLAEMMAHEFREIVLNGESSDEIIGERLGMFFVENAPKISSVYSAYCSSQAAGMQRLQDLSASSAKVTAFLKDTIEVARQYTNAWDLASLLIKPVQRVLKYPLLIKEILRKTDPLACDYTALQSALKQLNALADHINEQKRKYDMIDEIINNRSNFAGKATPASAKASKKNKKKDERLRATIGAAPAKDELPILIEDLHSTEMAVIGLRRSVGKWVRSINEALEIQTQATTRWIRLTEIMDDDDEARASERMERFLQLLQGPMLAAHLQADENVRSTLIPLIETLVGLFSSPKRIIQHHDEREVDYNRYHQLLAKGEKKAAADKRLADNANGFVAIHSQLLEELPPFLFGARTLLDHIVLVLSQLQTAFYQGTHSLLREFMSETNQIDAGEEPAQTDVAEEPVEAAEAPKELATAPRHPLPIPPQAERPPSLAPSAAFTTDMDLGPLSPISPTSRMLAAEPLPSYLNGASYTSTTAPVGLLPSPGTSFDSPRTPLFSRASVGTNSSSRTDSTSQESQGSGSNAMRTTSRRPALPIPPGPPPPGEVDPPARTPVHHALPPLPAHASPLRGTGGDVPPPPRLDLTKPGATGTALPLNTIVTMAARTDGPVQEDGISSPPTFLREYENKPVSLLPFKAGELLQVFAAPPSSGTSTPGSVAPSEMAGKSSDWALARNVQGELGWVERRRLSEYV